MNLDTTTPQPRRCGQCGQTMRAIDLAGHYGRKVEIDVCEPCSLIWFDELESVRLAGPGLVALIRLIHQATQKESGMAALPLKLPCQVCGEPLKRVYNRNRYGRTVQLECPNKHGFYQSFMLFLAEKGYFRPYVWADIKRITESGQRLECRHCGATLEPRPQDECPFCLSPVGLVDPARLASAIDAHAVAQPLRIAPLAKQSACPDCGAAVDLSQDLACPNCLSILIAPTTAGALAASEAVAAKIDENYTRQTPKVARKKLATLAEEEASFDSGPGRGETVRQAFIVLSSIAVLVFVGYAAWGMHMRKSVKVMNADGSETWLTASEFQDQESQKRKKEMARVPHAPTGTAPAMIETVRNGNRLTVSNRSSRRISLEVRLAYEQLEDSWSRCEMEPNERASLRSTLKPGASLSFSPASNCSSKQISKGAYEFTIRDEVGADLFKSDSAFFD